MKRDILGAIIPNVVFATDNIVVQLLRDAEKYEEVRQKLLDDDFNLSLAEVNYIGLSYFYLIANWENMIKRLRKAITEAEDGYKKLTEKETS